MANKKDASGFTPQQRHDIILATLKEFNKPTKVFHLRWKPGDLIDAKVLKTTPMFWYMKYFWNRKEIEALFFKARIEIDPLFDSALDQVFGGEPGPRWRGGGPDPKRQKWRERGYQKTKPWHGQQANNLDDPNNNNNNNFSNSKSGQSEDNNLLKNKLNNKLGPNSNDVWNAISDFGADKSIDYQTFSDNLKDRGINVSPMLAKQLFDQLAGPDGKITKKQMEELIKKLDAMKLPDNFANISLADLGDKLGCMTIMKRVLLAAAAGEPFNVDDFVVLTKFGVNIGAINFLGKLSDRDIPWDDRVKAMENISANLGTTVSYNNLLSKMNIPELLLGFAAQTLDNKPEVQKTAIDLLPNVFHQALDKGDPDTAIGQLEEILDNLFKVLDDPTCKRNHPAAKDAIDKIVNEIVKTQDPEAVLFLSGLLAEKCDIENTTSPEARRFALEQLQKIMFGNDSPYITLEKSKDVPIVDENKLPKKGSANREWLDIGTNKQIGPSENLMQTKDPKSYTDADNSSLNPKNVRSQQKNEDFKEPNYSGIGDDEKNESFSPEAPYANVSAYPPNVKPKEPVTVDASKSVDKDGKPCVNYAFDFGDKTPILNSKNPVVKHQYDKPGTYPITVTVTDKNNLSSDATANERVEPNDKKAPIAVIRTLPEVAKPGQPVTIDASESKDKDGKPCKNFIIDFGDGTPPIETSDPIVKHTYNEPGNYPITAVVKDKDGVSNSATTTIPIVPNPDAYNKSKNNKPINNSDPKAPTAIVKTYPPVAVPKEEVTADASESKDKDGNPLKNFAFDFGDGSPVINSNKPIAKHAYDKPGTYPVKVVVTDKDGLKSEATAEQKIVDPNAPKAVLKATPEQCKPNETVTADASDSRDYKNQPCTNFKFDFGDGSPVVNSNKPIVKHKYKKPGKYPVTCTVTDKNGKTNQDSVPVKILDPKSPIASIKSYPAVAKPLQEVTVDASESKDANGNPCKNFAFDFGDGSPVVNSNKPIAKHKYDKPGKYPITATVTDPNGLTNDATTIQEILPNLNSTNQGKDYTNVPDPTLSPNNPNAVLTTNPPTVKPNEEVTADASKSVDEDGNPCTNFSFDFGDGSPVVNTNKPIAKHAYKKPGTYPVKCVVTDKNGLKSPATVHQRVFDPNNPNPSMYDDDDPSKGGKGPNDKKYGGLKDKGNNSPQPPYDGKFNNKGKLGRDPFQPSNKNNANIPDDIKENENPMSSKEIGDEFRNVVSDGISKAIMDPNPVNNNKAKKLTDVMNQLNPKFPGMIDPEAKIRFNKWKGGPLKKANYTKPPSKKLPPLNPGTKAVHTIEQQFNINVANPALPDI